MVLISFLMKISEDELKLRSLGLREETLGDSRPLQGQSISNKCWT